MQPVILNPSRIINARKAIYFIRVCRSQFSSALFTHGTTDKAGVVRRTLARQSKAAYLIVEPDFTAVQ